MYSDDALLPISALQHIIFCERRAALIYIEKLWDENVYTAEGRVVHEQVHEVDTESRGDIRIVRGLWLKSSRLGLYGRADVVELHRITDDSTERQIALPQGQTWYPVPVEYKRGRLRDERSYAVQLCAQGLCLEEMLDMRLDMGMLYYAGTRRRLAVSFDSGLRKETEEAALRMHELVSSGITPKVRMQTKCGYCSLNESCLPSAMGTRRNASLYLKRAMDEANEEVT